MLGGVVTEIGGLVSHGMTLKLSTKITSETKFLTTAGAVVAREYGLPAIVAAAGATKVFKSGKLEINDFLLKV